jgi:trigger factor
VEIQVTDAGPNEKLLTFTIPKDRLEAAEERAARAISREIKIKGFRPGHAPRRIVENMVGAERIRSDAIEDLVPQLGAEAIEESELTPDVPATIESIEDGAEGVVVTLKLTFRPTLDEAPQYQGREIEVTSPEVSDDELEEQLDRIREQFAELETVERPAGEGDFVALDLSATRGGETVEEASATDLLYEVGSGSLIDGLDEQLVGAKAGDVVGFDASLPAGFGELAGTEVSFRVLVKEVKEKKLPELTDEWVGDVSEFETVDEFRADLQRRLVETKHNQARAQLKHEMLDSVLRDVDVEVPEPILGAEMEAILHRFAHQLEAQGVSLSDYLQITGQSQDTFIQDLKDQADRNVRTDLLLDVVAEAEGIEVTDEELDEYLEALAAQTEQEVEKLRTEVGDGVQALRSDILRRKALEALVKAAVPIDDQGTRVDLEGPGEETQ